jgi:transposase
MSMATRLSGIFGKGFPMDKPQAEALYDSGKNPTVGKLLELDQENKTLKAKIAALSTDSTNSSKPPSSDGPGVNKKSKKQGRRKRGGQIGHKGKKRVLLPASEMDHIQNIYPQTCEECGKTLTPHQSEEPSRPLRHQVFELPEIHPVKTEYRCHELACSCGHVNRAALPPEVAGSNFGPGVHAAVAYLASVHRGTRRGIADSMSAIFSLDISLGAICQILERVSLACAPETEHIRENIAGSVALNIDETGWKSAGSPRWLWVFVSSAAVFFRVASSRASRVLQSVLGESFSGVITSDDHSAYNKYHKSGVRQLCWAHLIRKLKGLKDGRASPDAYLFARHMLKEAGTLFSYWHAFKEAGCTREELWQATALIRGRMKCSCLRYSESSDTGVRTRAAGFLKNWDILFTFLRIEGIEPTNNAAERAIRPAVQWRKICFGNQSSDGERFTERILTVTRTCQIRQKNAFRFLTQLMTAFFRQEPLPSLIR